MGAAEQLFGLPGVAAGDKMAGLLADDPGPVQRAALPRPASACCAARFSRVSPAWPSPLVSRIGGQPQQVERHRVAVAVEQPDQLASWPA